MGLPDLSHLLGEEMRPQGGGGLPDLSHLLDLPAEPSSRIPTPQIPDFRRRLREMGHPEWETLDAPAAQTYFDRQGGTTGPQTLRSPAEHLADAQEANSTWNAVLAGFQDAMGLGEGQDSSATAYAPVTPTLGPVGRAGAALGGKALEALDYGLGWASRMAGQAASGQDVNVKDAFYPTFAEQHVPGISEALAEHAPKDEKFIERWGPNLAAALIAASGASGEILTDPEFLLGAGALGKAGAARRAGEAARARLATPEAQRARDVTDALDARATWAEGEAQRAGGAREKMEAARRVAADEAASTANMLPEEIAARQKRPGAGLVESIRGEVAELHPPALPEPAWAYRERQGLEPVQPAGLRTQPFQVDGKSYVATPGEGRLPPAVYEVRGEQLVPLERPPGKVVQAARTAAEEAVASAERSRPPVFNRGATGEEPDLFPWDTGQAIHRYDVENRPLNFPRRDGQRPASMPRVETPEAQRALPAATSAEFEVKGRRYTVRPGPRGVEVYRADGARVARPREEVLAAGQAALHQAETTPVRAPLEAPAPSGAVPGQALIRRTGETGEVVSVDWQRGHARVRTKSGEETYAFSELDTPAGLPPAARAAAAPEPPPVSPLAAPEAPARAVENPSAGAPPARVAAFEAAEAGSTPAAPATVARTPTELSFHSPAGRPYKVRFTDPDGDLTIVGPSGSIVQTPARILKELATKAVSGWKVAASRALGEMAPRPRSVPRPPEPPSRRALVNITNNTRQNLTYAEAQSIASSPEFRGYADRRAEGFEAHGYTVLEKTPQVGHYVGDIDPSGKFKLGNVQDVDYLDELTKRFLDEDDQFEGLRFSYGRHPAMRGQSAEPAVAIEWTLPEGADVLKFSEEMTEAGFKDRSQSVDLRTGYVILTDEEAVQAAQTLQELVVKYDGRLDAREGWLRFIAGDKKLRQGSSKPVTPDTGGGGADSPPGARPVPETGHPPAHGRGGDRPGGDAPPPQGVGPPASPPSGGGPLPSTPDLPAPRPSSGAGGPGMITMGSLGGDLGKAVADVGRLLALGRDAGFNVINRMVNAVALPAVRALGKSFEKLADRNTTVQHVVRALREFFRPGGNAADQVLEAHALLQDRVGAVVQETLDEMVPLLLGDFRPLGKGGKNYAWTPEQQRAVGALIKGETPDTTLPRGGAAAAALVKRRMADAGFRVIASNLGVDAKFYRGLSQAAQEELGELIRGTKQLDEATTETLRAHAEAAIRRLEKSGAILFDEDGNRLEGILDNTLHEKTFFRNYGRYFPRLYRRHDFTKLQAEAVDEIVALSPEDLQDQVRDVLLNAYNPVAYANAGVRSRMKQVIRDRFMARKDLKPEVREAMGEILEPAFPLAKAHWQMHQAVETQGFFRFLAQNDAWVAPRFQGDAGTAAMNDPVSGRPWVKIDDDPAFGALRGRLVHPDVADFLENVRAQMSEGEAAWDQMVAAWKYSKTVLNPASHGRNIGSNVIMADLAGMGLHPEAFRRHLEATRSYLAQDETYRLARKQNLFGGTFYEEEVKRLAGVLLEPLAQPQAGGFRLGEVFKRLGEYTKAGAKASAQWAGRVYQAEEAVFKLSLFRWAMERQGMSAADAAKFAKDWLFDYSRQSKFVRWRAGKNVRWDLPGANAPKGTKARFAADAAQGTLTFVGKSFASPFATWSLNVMPKLLRAAFGVGRGSFDVGMMLRFWKYPAFLGAGGVLSAQALGLTKDQSREAQPDWMRSLIPGNHTLLPWRDEQGNLQYLDLSGILPWAQFVGTQGDTSDPEARPGVKPWAFVGGEPGGPGMPVTELLFNRSLFTGRDIREKGMTGDQKVAAVIDHLWKAWLPALAPGIPGVTDGDFGHVLYSPRVFARNLGTDLAGVTGWGMSRSGGPSAARLSSSLWRIPDAKGRQRAVGATLADVLVGLRARSVDPVETRRGRVLARKRLIQEIDGDIRRTMRDKGLLGSSPIARQAMIRRLQERKRRVMQGDPTEVPDFVHDLVWELVEEIEGQVAGVGR